MFVLIVGGGKVGLNTARQLIQLGHEIVVVEQRSTRYDAVARVIGDEYVVFGDGTEIWVLEKAGIGRADMVVAVTGDDEDNIIIAQIAELKFGVPKVVARVNNPFNQADLRSPRHRKHRERHHGHAQSHHARTSDP